MAEREGGSSISLRSLFRMVRGPKSGWTLRSSMIRSSIASGIWCGQRSGRQVWAVRAAWARPQKKSLTLLMWESLLLLTSRLDRWFGEARSSGHCQGIVHPDGIGTVKGPSTSTSFFLELDRGTEDIDQLAAKIIDYDEAAVSKHLPRLLLFCFQTERRERSAMPALRSRSLIVATATLERHLAHPLGPNWLPIAEERRVKLLEIPTPAEVSP